MAGRKPRFPASDLVTSLGRSRVPAPWPSPSGGKEEECVFYASCALRFGGGSDTRRMTKGVPKAIPAPEKKWVPWPGTPRRTQPQRSCPNSPGTPGARPFRDSYRKELNCDRLRSCFSEESLPYCKRGSGDARAAFQPCLPRRFIARQALATPPARSSSRASFEVAARASAAGGGKPCPSPPPAALLPRRQLGPGCWGPVPPMTGTYGHLVPWSTRVPSIPSPSVSLSWTKPCALSVRDSCFSSHGDRSPQEGPCDLSQRQNEGTGQFASHPQALARPGRLSCLSVSFTEDLGGTPECQEPLPRGVSYAQGDWDGG